jgi:hypothetical protein
MPEIIGLAAVLQSARRADAVCFYVAVTGQ